VDEVEFQLRRQEMVAVRRCEADKVRQRLEMEQETRDLEESTAGDSLDDNSPLVGELFQLNQLIGS